MLIELALIAAAGLVGYKAITDPEGTKRTAEKLIDKAGEQVEKNYDRTERQYERGEISDEEYLDRQGKNINAMATYAEYLSKKSKNEED